MSGLFGFEFDATSFACDGPILGIPHGLNVLTNLAFLIVGVWGIVRTLRSGRRADGSHRDALGLWISAALTCFGSGLYHIYLDQPSLAVDRLCIAGIIAFFAAFSVTRALGRPASAKRTVLFLAIATGSVGVWVLGGTSIPYGVVQYGGALAVLVLYVRAFRAGRVPRSDVVAVCLFLGLYGVAKVFEVTDALICDLTGVFGGHPIKHLVAAAGLLALVPLTASRPTESAKLVS